MASPPSVSSALCPSPERDNFFRVSALLITGGTKLLQEIFDSIHSPTLLPSVLSNPTVESTLKKAKLTKEQWDLLYLPTGGYGESKNLDITLLFRLLRCICNLSPPATGWDALPGPTDKSLTADLARLKHYRNSIYGHAKETKLKDEDFQKIWNDIKEAMFRLANSLGSPREIEWMKIVSDHLSAPLTVAHERNVKDLLSQWYENNSEMEETLQQFGSTLQSVAAQLQRVEFAVEETAYVVRDTQMQWKQRQSQGQSEGIQQSLILKSFNTFILD